MTGKKALRSLQGLLTGKRRTRKFFETEKRGHVVETEDSWSPCVCLSVCLSAWVGPGPAPLPSPGIEALIRPFPQSGSFVQILLHQHALVSMVTD